MGLSLKYTCIQLEESQSAFETGPSRPGIHFEFIIHCKISTCIPGNYFELITLLNMYSGRSCNQTPSGPEKGVHNWSWLLTVMVLVSGH